MNTLLDEYKRFCDSGNARSKLFVCLNKFKKNFPWRSKYPIFLTEGRIDISKKSTIIDNLQFPPCAMNGSNTDSEPRIRFFGTLETFWSQGCMSVKRIFRETKKKLQKMPIIRKIHHFAKAPKRC